VISSHAALPLHGCSHGSSPDVPIHLQPARSCSTPAMRRRSSLGSLCPGGRHHATSSEGMFAICPDVAKLLAVVALSQGILGFVVLLR
jgi:hypothetical protein